MKIKTIKIIGANAQHSAMPRPRMLWSHRASPSLVVCNTCERGIGNKPINCESKEHQKYYEARKTKYNDRRINRRRERGIQSKYKRRLRRDLQDLIEQRCKCCGRWKNIDTEFERKHKGREFPMNYSETCLTCQRPLWTVKQKSKQRKAPSMIYLIHPWKRMNRKIYFERIAA